MCLLILLGTSYLTKENDVITLEDCTFLWLSLRKMLNNNLGSLYDCHSDFEITDHFITLESCTILQLVLLKMLKNKLILGLLSGNDEEEPWIDHIYKNFIWTMIDQLGCLAPIYSANNKTFSSRNPVNGKIKGRFFINDEHILELVLINMEVATTSKLMPSNSLGGGGKKEKGVTTWCSCYLKALLP
uniref:Uncharacterized protein n=1 Tax=Solanum lycopersicum TaxID=4081 RepID=A0A3Q7FC38_SOLLC